MKTAEELKSLIRTLDKKGYPAYKALKGEYRFQGYTLCIEHVQGDPFAAPSKVGIVVEKEYAGFPEALFATTEKRVMLQDRLTREFDKALRRYAGRKNGSGKSGMVEIDHAGQEILERSACTIKDGTVFVQIEVGFPAFGRSIHAAGLEEILYEELPVCVKEALCYASLDKASLKRDADLAEDQQAIRTQLKERGLVAFVANGSILPRESGVSARPLKGAVPFQSPASLEVALTLPHYGVITGMGIPKGLTLIVGGGYHGKSTLLQALESGVYSHIAGDGREYVITEESAVKLRAEDGRSIAGVDISLFINHLPNGKRTDCFFTEDASGSTSQAAAVMEAAEAGARLFLIDEDTSATNFMLRDPLMQEVIGRDKEPITPFLERTGEFYAQYGISTILVAGSSGAYFHTADTVIQMDAYVPKDITKQAKEAAKRHTPPTILPSGKPRADFVRIPEKSRKAEERIKVKLLGRDSLLLNKETIDLRYVEQIAEDGQLLLLGYLTAYAKECLFDGKKTLDEIVTELERCLREKGYAEITGMPYLPAAFAIPRRQEIFACLNRYRGLRIKEK